MKKIYTFADGEYVMDVPKVIINFLVGFFLGMLFAIAIPLFAQVVVDEGVVSYQVEKTDLREFALTAEVKNVRVPIIVPVVFDDKTGLTGFYDHEYGNICYQYFESISCVKI